VSSTWPLFETEQAVCFLGGLIFVALYYLLSIFFFLCFYAVYKGGYYQFDMGKDSIWDSTYIHTPAAIYPYFTAGIMITSVFVLMLDFYMSHVVSVSLPIGKMSAENCCVRFIKKVVELLNNWNHWRCQHRVATMHLLHLYILFWTIQGMMVLSAIQSASTFIIPFVFRIPYIEEDRFGLYFRIMTVQFMTIPLLLYVLVHQWWHSPQNSQLSHEFDGIFALIVARDYRYRLKALKALRHYKLFECDMPSMIAEADRNEAFLELQVATLSSLVQLFVLSSLDPTVQSFDRMGPDCLTENATIKPDEPPRNDDGYQGNYKEYYNEYLWQMYQQLKQDNQDLSETAKGKVTCTKSKVLNPPTEVIEPELAGNPEKKLVPLNATSEPQPVSSAEIEVGVPATVADAKEEEEMVEGDI